MERGRSSNSSGQAGGPNHSRLVSMTYPNNRVLTYDYGTAGGTDDRLSQVSSLKDGAQVLEAYSYLGLGTVVQRVRPQNGTELRYFQYGPTDPAPGGDQYTGLDRFGRVVDQRWLYTIYGDDIDRFQYGYDADSNRLFKKNLVDAAFSELYHADGAANGYDNFNQLTAFRRGTLNASNDSILGTASRSQDWTLDAMGNWDLVTATGPAGTDDRTHNAQNQITSLAGQTTPTYDRNGNMTRDQAGRTLSYDAWNRLVVVSSGGTPIVVYAYDALNRRTVDYRNPVVRSFYYDAAWQLLEERVAGTAERQYVWAVGYVDGLVLRDRNADGNAANSLEERRYVQQDANWNVTALADTNGGILERYGYDPYGTPLILSTTAPLQLRQTSESDWNYLHQGGRYDPASGLYHFRHRDYSPALGRWIGSDPSAFDAGDTNFYRYVSNRSVSAVDPSGLRMIEVKVAAYIGKHIGGPWLPEPASPINGWEFHTDYREPGERFEKSRIRSWFQIDTTTLGTLTDFSANHAAGQSERRRRKWFYEGENPFCPACNPYYYDAARTIKVKSNDSFENFGCGASKFRIQAAGNYPYVTGSPDIDYTLSIVFTRTGRGDVQVNFAFQHNLFPDYEVIVDGHVFSYPTTDSGPGMLNLTRSRIEDEQFVARG